MSRLRRTNRYITAWGRPLPLCVWAEHAGLSSQLILDRLKRLCPHTNKQWKIELTEEEAEMIFAPPRSYRKRKPSREGHGTKNSAAHEKAAH